MARRYLFVAAMLCFISHALDAQQTYNEKRRAHLEQPLAAPKPLLFWVERLSHPNAEVRQQSDEFLVQVVEQTGLFDPVFDEEVVHRRTAFRNEARLALPVLLHQLRNGDLSPSHSEATRSSLFTALYLLMAMGADAEAAIPDLKSIAADERHPFEVRMQCLMALLYMVPETQPVGPLFLELFNSIPPELQKEVDDSYQNMRDEESLAFGSIGITATYFFLNLSHTGHTKCEVPTLVKIAAGDLHVVYRAISIVVLGELSFDARAAVPELRNLLKDEEPLIRECALNSLLMIQDDETLIPELLPLLRLDEQQYKAYEQELKDYFLEQRIERAEWSEWQPDEIQTWLMPEIKSTFEHGSGFQKRQTIQILGHIGPNAEAALPQLRKALKDPEEDTRRMAAEAIRKIERE